MENPTPDTAAQESTDKLGYWTKQFLAWQQSGESQSDFCKNRNLSYAKFCYWRYHVKRAKKKKKSEPAENKFVPITIKPNELLSSEEKPVMSIRLPNGVCISVPVGADKSQHNLVMQLLGVKL